MKAQPGEFPLDEVVAYLNQLTQEANRRYGLDVDIVVSGRRSWFRHGPCGMMKIQFGVYDLSVCYEDGYFDMKSALDLWEPVGFPFAGMKAVWAVWVHEYAHALSAAEHGRCGHSDWWRIAVRELQVMFDPPFGAHPLNRLPRAAKPAPPRPAHASADEIVAAILF